MKTVRPAAWRAVLPVISFVLFGAWTADALKGATPFLDWLSPEARNLIPQPKLLVAVVLLVLFFCNTYWLYRARKVWRLPPRVLNEKTDADPRKVLVMGLSLPPKSVKGFDLGSGTSVVLYKDAPGDLLPIHSLASAMADMRNHNWQQSLRAVNYHAKTTLELLIVVPSSGDDGSGHFTDQFKQWMAHYQKSGDWKPFEIEIAAAVNYEALNVLQIAYTSAIGLAGMKGFKESDVVIDVTAGQKTTSIAAAMVTLTSDADFQYVQTGKAPKIQTYSVLSEGPRDPGV